MPKEKERKEAPHPKTVEELNKILEGIKEIGGSKQNSNPTKHGDWSLKGRVSDF